MANRRSINKQHNRAVRAKLNQLVQRGNPLICTDGSLDLSQGSHSAGGIFLHNGNRITFSQRFLGINHDFEKKALFYGVQNFLRFLPSSVNKVCLVWDQHDKEVPEQVLGLLNPFCDSIEAVTVFSHNGFSLHNAADRLAKRAELDARIVQSSFRPYL